MTYFLRSVLLFLVLLSFTNLRAQKTKKPTKAIDGIVEKHLIEQSRTLSYPDLREADLFWEKEIWRIVDTRELMNKHFSYPKRSFFSILKEAVLRDVLTAYSVETNDFSYALTSDEVYEMLVDTDTIITYDPKTYDPITTVVQNVMDDQSVKRFRLKEVWYFDEEHASMKVRIIGIAPVIDEYSDNGDFLYERPLFWVYYPHARKMLSKEEVFVDGNDAARLSWEDVLEMRFFSGSIIKESNIEDLRLKDMYSGVDRLMEAQKIERSIFNFEQDLWSY